MKPWEHVEQVLEQVPEKSHVEQPFGRYRGYSRGTITFKRKDGAKIQEEDLVNLRQLSYGQIHSVRGTAGEDTCSVYFECDSTD